MKSPTHIVTTASADMRDSPRCPACGAIGYRDDRYCACCGSAMTAVCRQCGTAREHPVANYCTHCGARLGGMATAGTDIPWG
jgi:hypothetical protein